MGYHCHGDSLSWGIIIMGIQSNGDSLSWGIKVMGNHYLGNHWDCAAFDPGHEAACAGSDVVQLASGECRLAPAGPGPGSADTRTLNTTVLYQAPVKQHNW